MVVNSLVRAIYSSNSQFALVSKTGRILSYKCTNWPQSFKFIFYRQKQLHTSIAHGGGVKMFWVDIFTVQFWYVTEYKETNKNIFFCSNIENLLHKSVPHIEIYRVHAAINHSILCHILLLSCNVLLQLTVTATQKVHWTHSLHAEL